MINSLKATRLGTTAPLVRVLLQIDTFFHKELPSLKIPKMAGFVYLTLIGVTPE